MSGTSKCGQCVNREKCHIRMHLNTIINKAIKKAEEEVKRLSPGEIDYMIMTDISVIPTRCNDFMSKDGLKKEYGEQEGSFFLSGDLATSAIS